MEKSELSQFIKAKALEVGFTKAGISGVQPFEEESGRLREWLEEGMHGRMHYMERSEDRRNDVRNILPSAKSILSLALNYYHPTEQEPQFPKISRYAWGTDYHEVIPPMLDRLLGEIRAVAPNLEAKSYTDTGPLFEKAIAQRAGLGWIGKHSNLITREVGSWVFLAEILLDLELTPDFPGVDLCGTCTRCIDACPTNAILEPYKVDATKCISYLTIELKPEHSIPAPQAGQMENWIYGCDICQDVCPWNRFEKPTEIEAFSPRLANLELTIEQIDQMEQTEFSERFRKSPIKRTKLAGLKRNAKVLSVGKNT